MASQSNPVAPQRDIVRFGFELQHRRTPNAQNGELHHHDFYEVYLLISGDVTYTVEGQLIHVYPGDILLISPQELHQVFIRSDSSIYERLVLWISPHLAEQLSSQDTALNQVLCSSRPGYRNKLRPTADEYAYIRSLMEMLYQEARQERFGADLLCRSLLTQVLVAINRLAEEVNTSKEDIFIGTVSRITEYINRHYNEPITLDTLADRFYLSKYHLSHAFKEQVGTSIYRYVIKKRLQVARELLAKGDKPSQICTACGFNDYVGFYRAFKAEYGISPREFIQSLDAAK